MSTQERSLVSALIFLMLFLWLGFIWHRNPAFPGSFTGGMLGIFAAVFMFIPFLYLLIKRIKPLKKWLTKRVPMPKLLVWHIYGGVIGPILGLLHSAHRFDSTVGVVLIMLMLIVVISGFVGRYLLGHISSGVRAKTAQRNELYQAFQQASSAVSQGDSGSYTTEFTTHMSLLPAISFSGWPDRSKDDRPSREILRLVDALSDIDYSIAMHDIIKRWFKRWLKFHIVISCTLYLVLIFHIVTEVYFGLRWL